MKIIEVRPSKKFKGAWESVEAPGVEPAFAQPDAKAKALSYTRHRFGGQRWRDPRLRRKGRKYRRENPGGRRGAIRPAAALIAMLDIPPETGLATS